MKILELQNVSYRYHDGNSNVLHNMNWSFETGKSYAIKGKSGSGKTTLLSLLAGLEKVQEGDILFQGKSLKNKNLDNYRSCDIGIVFQSFNLLYHLNGIENIILAMEISHLSEKDKQKKAIELLEKVGLTEEDGKRKILKLSGGEQQRVAIARSLASNPPLILADEPTGNLDHDTENDIIELLNMLAHKEQKCVIIVTHSKNVADKVNSIYELKKRD